MPDGPEPLVAADDMENAAIRVLLIDDHDMFAESLSRLLEREDGFDVVGSEATAERGIAAAATSCPDVAIVDWHLPDMDGAETAAAVLAASPSTRVLILTGSAGDDALAQAIEAGCAGFLTKDQAVGDLVAALRAVSAGDAYIPAEKLARLLPYFARRASPPHAELSQREREVLSLAAAGLSNKAIADHLFLSVHTVRNHMQNALAKLHAHSKLEAVAIATREGLLRPG